MAPCIKSSFLSGNNNESFIQETSVMSLISNILIYYTFAGYAAY